MLLSVYTHIVNSINEGVVAAVAHSQPVAAEPYDVDIPVSENKHDSYQFVIISMQAIHLNISNAANTCLLTLGHNNPLKSLGCPLMRVYLIQFSYTYLKLEAEGPSRNI